MSNSFFRDAAVIHLILWNLLISKFVLEFKRHIDHNNYFCMQPGTTMQNGVLQIQNNHCRNNIFRSKSDSALSRKNDGKLKQDYLMTDNIDLLTRFNINKSITNIPNIKFQTYHLSNSENRLLYNNGSLHDSFSNNMSVSLSLIPVSSLDLFLVKNKVHKSENDVCAYRNIAGACMDEEEILFNRSSKAKNLSSTLQCSMNEEVINMFENNLIKDKHDKNYFKEQTAAAETNVFQTEQSCKEIIDLQSQINNNETLNEKNQDEKEDLCNGSISTLTLNAHVQNSLTPRPTLADDSKLVKMSLLTNPITIMQSNVQLLNKSRNFFNFITEKSTNIMEKALLPQHLAMKYNHISKSIETNAMMGFYTNSESSLKDIIGKTRLDTDLTTNPSNSRITNCMVIPNHDKNKDKLNSITNSEIDINLSTCIKGNKTCDNLENAERQLHNSKNKVSNEKEYIFQKNDVDRLDCNIISERAQDVSLPEINENESNFLHRERLLNDMHEKDSSKLSNLIESNILRLDSLEHPLYLTLLEDYTSLKLKNAKLLERIEHLEKSNQLNKSFCETQTNTDTFILQIENLEKTINKLRADLNTSLDMQEALRKECMAINKEKENMVMRYATSEKQLIDSQRYV